VPSTGHNSITANTVFRDRYIDSSAGKRPGMVSDLGRWSRALQVHRIPGESPICVITFHGMA
jgi:hypothetical protein